jgi:hypothetical protein
MRVIAARSKFFYQRQQTIQPESVLPQLDSYRVVGPGGRMPLFVNSFYGNGGTKFLNDFRELGLRPSFSDLNKNPSDFRWQLGRRRNT